MKKPAALILCVLILVGCPGPTKTGEVQFQLTNGLSVILRHIDGADKVALITLFDIGEDQDPPGKSGMGHLIEHLYVTAAAGDLSPRSIQAFMAAYPMGWNAQTGRNYTVVAAVFPKKRLKTELTEAAARLGDLKPQQSDLRREIPRMNFELENMYERIPMLAAQNQAVKLRVPHRPGSRKGGFIEQIKTIELAQIKNRLKDYYKPVNATLIIAGDIDVDKDMAMVIKTFTKIAPGRKIASAHYRSEVPQSSISLWPSQSLSRQGHVALAVAAPQVNDKLFPAFLILAARLQMNSQALKPPKQFFPVVYAVLDRPETLLVHLPVGAGQKAAAVEKKLCRFVADTLAPPLSSADKTITRQLYGFALGLQKYPDHVLAKNVYGVALATGRRKQLRVDPELLAEKLAAVTQQDLALAAKKYFAPESYSTALVYPPKK